MSKIALGTVQFGMNYGIKSTSVQVQYEEVSDILNYARSKNIDLLDTAISYGNSEIVLGRLNINDFKIITKTRNFDNHILGVHEAELIKKDLINSLKRLKQDSVYGVLVHNANDLLKPGSKKIFNKLVDLKRSEKVKKIGVSIYDYTQLKSIIENYDIDIVQLPFNIIDKRLVNNNIFKNLQNMGIEVHARSVFLQSLLLMTEYSRPAKFKNWDSLWKIWHEWLNDNHITALEAAIRYAISIPEISKVLVGVDTRNQLEEIVTASHGLLPRIPSELFTDDVYLLNPSNWEKL